MKVLIGTNGMGLEKGIPELQQRFPDLTFVHCPARELTAGMIADADIYIGWLNREIYLAAKQLRWIQSPSSGVNYFLDIPELVASDCLLTSASGTHGAAVADSAMAMILAFTRGIRQSVRHQQERVWRPGEIRPTLVELTGATMGIIGCGAIGRALAKRAKAFDMCVNAVDLFPNNKPAYVDELWGLDRLDDLLRTSDYVVVMVPYTAQTANMIGAREIGLMRPDAMLVVMSRGGIVDQDALVQALQEKRIAAAALDVFKPEPLPADHPLWGLDNVLITAHIAGGTQHEGKYVLEIFTENLDRFLHNRLPLRNQVDKLAGF
ncbi:MAG TPA: D-2-hydroxyacid dehydrogenase [Caldilineaceae bacterium]|nr:D-2-hydroxyacid dehydrogenase [Caldilineaceae bacterium]